MKFLFLINSLQTGGAERVVQILSNHFTAHQHRVSIVCTDNKVSSYHFDNQVSISVLKSGTLCHGFGKILAIPLQAIELSLFLKRAQPDVIVSFLVRANLINITSAVLSPDRPIIISERNVTAFNYNERSLKNRFMKLMINTLYPKADKIIANSIAVKQGLVDNHINEKKIRVIHNPLALTYSPGNSHPALFDIPTVISCGRFVKQKNYGLLLKAFKLVLKQTPAKLVIIGDGPERSVIEKLAKNLKIIADITFTGFIKDPQERMAQADIFVLSSQFEGFGNVILEAMETGLPVISTNCPGGPVEILANGEYGMLVPCVEEKALAKAILELLSDDKKRLYFKEKSLERSRHFDVNRIAPQYLEFCTDIS